MAKTKEQMQKEIMDLVKEQKAIYDQADADRREWKAQQLAAGTSPDFFQDDFYFNGYIFTTDLHNIICSVVFDKLATIHHERNRYHGTYDEHNTTQAEDAALTKIVNGMIAQKVIKPSKSGTMVKVLI